MLAVRLGKQLEAAIARIAEATVSTRSNVVREAVVRYLEDREDAALAAQVKKAGGRVKSIAAVRNALGLEG